MTLDEAMGWLERGLEVKDGWPMRVCNTGEPYLTFCVGGVKPEGAYVGGAQTEDLAIRYWLKHALKYKLDTTKGKDPGHFTLYWRTKPEVERMSVEQVIEALEFGDEPDWDYKVYSRFIITDRAEMLEAPKS